KTMRKRNSKVVLLLLLALLFSLLASARTKPSKPTFVLATVHGSDPANLSNTPGISVDASHAVYYSVSLKQLIMAAYGVTADQVSGPVWLESNLYDIVATLPAGASEDDLPAMLQSFLKVRFKLAVHTTSKNQQVMALVVAKGGPKLLPATASLLPIKINAPGKSGPQEDLNTPDGPIRFTQNGPTSISLLNVRSENTTLQSNSITMKRFADLLTRLMQGGGRVNLAASAGSGYERLALATSVIEGDDRGVLSGSGDNRLDSSEYAGDWKVVVDQTGLKGEYQVTVQSAKAMPLAESLVQGSSLVGGPDRLVFSSVQKLGLKLKLSTLKVVVSLVVNHAEKNPTAN